MWQVQTVLVWNGVRANLLDQPRPLLGSIVLVCESHLGLAIVRRVVLRQDLDMEGDLQDLRRLRDKIAAAYAEALRLGDARVASIMMKSMTGVDSTIEKLQQDYARTRPQVEALKRLVGAT